LAYANIAHTMIFFTKILKEYGPYLAAFTLGFILALRGCGDSEQPETIIVEKPIPTIERIEVRDTVRFAYRDTRIDTIRDTVTKEIIRLNTDTILTVDTLKIVEAWLTEVAKYDTTLDFENHTLDLKWQNYQNFTENLTATLMPKSTPNSKRLGILMYAKTGIRSDFKDQYAVVIGGGLLFERKRVVFGADYGYSGQHTINGVVGYKLR